MLEDRIIRILLSLFLLLAVIMVSTMFFGLIKTEHYSAYGACRKVAMNTKGYAIWNHEQTFPIVFWSRIVFSDGYNDLSCDAIGIGPFWTVRGSMHTLVGCGLNLNTGDMCPEDYFGVNP